MAALDVSDSFRYRDGVRHVLRVVQVRAVDAGDDGEAAQVQRRRSGVDLGFLDAEFADQQRADVRVDVGGDLEPDGRAEAAAQQFLLQRLQQVLGVVLFDLQVLVAGDAEGVVLQHLHARRRAGPGGRR